MKKREKDELKDTGLKQRTVDIARTVHTRDFPVGGEKKNVASAAA